MWFVSAITVPLFLHLQFVVFNPDGLKDGQYLFIVPAGVGAGIVGGIVPFLITRWFIGKKPDFARVVPIVAIGYWVCVFLLCLLAEVTYLPKAQWGWVLIVVTFGYAIGIPLGPLFVFWLFYAPMMEPKTLLIPLFAWVILLPLGVAFLFTRSEPNPDPSSSGEPS